MYGLLFIRFMPPGLLGLGKLYMWLAHTRPELTASPQIRYDGDVTGSWLNDSRFRVRSMEFEPAYLALYRSGELHRRVEHGLDALQDCRICPRSCGVDRYAGQSAACHTGRFAQVASYFPHFGEEDCLRGWRGSGTIFFARCNLRCVFCQNDDISQGRAFPEQDARGLARMMLELQASGCHNINLVTPEHVVPQVLEGLLLAVAAGLRLPIVYNTSAYDSLESLELLDGVVDIYMPDFKIWDDRSALKYLLAKDYPEAARQAIREMHRQVGPLKMDENGLARRGVLVRHLVMPAEVAGTEHILQFLAQEISPDTYVNVMGQYHPAARVVRQKYREKYAEIDRRITPDEYRAAQAAAHRLGLRLDKR
jgi:putative pyruvate formate lyase activating enzyme